MPRFSGKVAIITGFSNGIGRATALQMASEGALVTIHGRDLDDLMTTEKLLLTKTEKLCVVQGDITDERVIQELVTKTLDQFGRIDVLVNNAGLALDLQADPKSMELFDRMQEVNVKSMLKLVQLVEPHLEKTKGNIVITSSVASLLPRPKMLYYSMARASEDHFVRGRAHELAKKGIRINTVNPGVTRTNLFRRAGMNAEQTNEFIGNLSTKIPMGRVGEPEEIARAICFLASEDASYITGVILPVDGGTAQFAQL